MTRLDILLPFGLPPAEMARDLLRELKTPAFATLIARAAPRQDQAFDEFSRALPHEAWLTGQFGLEERLRVGGSPPVAVSAMQALGLVPDAGTWFVLHPAHLHIARDHLVLTNLRQLTITEEESHALYVAAKPLFEEFGKPLMYGDAHTWFVRADTWGELLTSTPDAACGHNIDIWMPHGSGDRDWRKLQNEVQMLWHTHPVNAERESHGRKPINSLWLWGGTPTDVRSVPARYKEFFNLPGGTHPFCRLADRQIKVVSAFEAIAAKPERGLAVLDCLIEAALSSDWSAWLARFHALETDWFIPLLDALKGGKIDQISLILTHGTHLSEFTSSKQSLRKFWIKPSLARLIQ